MAISVPPPSGRARRRGSRRSPNRSRAPRRGSGLAPPQGVFPLLEDQDAAPLAGHRPSRRRSNGRHAPPGRPASATSWCRPSGRGTEGGSSSRPRRRSSRRPCRRAMIRAASPMARFDDASASVIVLLGPWQSIRIEMWQASMFGRYFSSQIGSILGIPSRPQAWIVERPRCGRGLADGRCQLDPASVEIRPAPRSMPIRVGSTPAAPARRRPSPDCQRGRDAELDVAGHVLPALA